LADINVEPSERSVDDIIEGIFSDESLYTIEIPDEAVTLAVVVYQLYAYILSPTNRVLGLDHFVSGAVNDFVPVSHPNHPGITSFLYAQALDVFFTGFN
jgi:hypothetical protein